MGKTVIVDVATLNAEADAEDLELFGMFPRSCDNLLLLMHRGEMRAVITKDNAARAVRRAEDFLIGMAVTAHIAIGAGIVGCLLAGAGNWETLCYMLGGHMAVTVGAGLYRKKPKNKGCRRTGRSGGGGLGVL